ncbi:MAG: carbon-nitrogen hydrolase family protein [Planctomycetota bacterium]|nr:carbon-nitrogen hydrolase family protein [Planctomycetota bacterium]
MKKVRIVSISSKGHGSLEANREKMVSQIEMAGTCNPDFVVFTEGARQLGLPRDGEDCKGESIPGPLTEALGAAAAKANTHVVVGMYEKDGNTKFNASALIGREGQVIGKYHKVQPTIGEIEDDHITPGVEAPTWETDCGRVGMCICFDLKFPEIPQMLARNKARIVFFSSAFNGGARQAAIARDHGYFLVISQPMQSSIVDMCGTKLGWTGFEEPLVRNEKLLPFAVADINADSKAYHLDFNQDKLGAIQTKYGLGVRFHIQRPEATFVMESMMDDVCAEDIEKEFELEDLWDYYDRARGVRKVNLDQQM